MRFLWNLGLEQWYLWLQRARNSDGKRKYPSVGSQCKELTALRAENIWLANLPRNASEEIFWRLEAAWAKCFNKKAARPKFKQKESAIAICEAHSRAFSVRNGKLIFPKINEILAVVDRPLEGKPKQATIKRDIDQWYVYIVCEILIDILPRKSTAIVGIDRGIINIAADSDNNIIQNPKFLRRSLNKLARAQRSLDRKISGSNNKRKQKLRVGKIHRKIRNQRKQFLHNISFQYVTNHSVIALENLRIDQMIKAGGNIAKGIGDSGWGMLRRMLEYKLNWHGGRLILVPPPYTSQACSKCKHIDKESRVSQSEFCCTKCKFTAHADINAACNIRDLAVETTGTVCGGLVTRQPKKQKHQFSKPTSVSTLN